MNPLINAGNTEYLDYKIVDNNFVSISPTIGAHNNIYVEEYTIETDESLLPFTSHRV